MKNSIWYVGGKSAGHIVPLLTLAAQSSEPSVFITTHRALDAELINRAGLQASHCALYIPDINRKHFWLIPLHALAWLYACIRLMVLFFKTRPQKIISTGGLSAVPVFLFAQLLRIPCELFELNAVPGYAVKFLAPLSSKIFYCYKTVLLHIQHKALHYKPYPVREFVLPDRYNACRDLALDPAKKTLCFLGGSQGSHFINDFAVQVVSGLSACAVQIIHQTGTDQVTKISKWYRENGYQAFVIAYQARMELVYSAADFVVCRAGAGTLWELEYMDIPTCIIPLETATTDHQLHNAEALCQQKPQQFFMVRQADAHHAREKIISFLGPKSQSHEDHQDLFLVEQ